MNPLSPQDTLERKERMGVSYPELGRRIGVSHVTVMRVLKNEESGVDLNRGKILMEANAALDDIERERGTGYLLDGHPVDDIDEFISLNDFDIVTEQAIRAMRAGQKLTLGGGAAASLTLEKVYGHHHHAA